MNNSEEDEIVTILAVIVIVAVAGPVVIAHFTPWVRAALLQWHVLTTSGVMVPVAGSAGLDLGRLAILGGIVVLGLLGAFWGLRRRVALKAARR